MANTPPSPRLIPSALTSVAAVQTWVDGVQPDPTTVSNTTSIGLMVALINSASRAILSVASRDSFLVRSVTETRTGYDMPTILLQNWPVLSIESVSIGGVSVAAQTTFGNAGFVFDPWDGTPPGAQQRLFAIGSLFSSVPNSTVVTYTSGYATRGEQQTVPSDGYVWPYEPSGPFAADWKVLDATGAVMTPVTVSPAVGQYVPMTVGTSGPSTDPTGYQFNAAQGSVSLYYSFIPNDIAYACTKWVGEMYRYRARIGLNSQSAQGQITTSYAVKVMPDDVKLVINQYNRVASV